MLLAVVSYDQTKTTRIEKQLLKHSFMLLGLVTVISAVNNALIFCTILS